MIPVWEHAGRSRSAVVVSFHACRVFDVANGLADLRARTALDALDIERLGTPVSLVIDTAADDDADVDFDDFAVANPLVRPYARTGGRTPVRAGASARGPGHHRRGLAGPRPRRRRY
ncbi:hypothetical protein [Amycolatopsis sp. lyj-112]|uniref:hypothetical protein n=1 Tax=Amycolatopsis sp. lyj-112 TaxID=2789288 RepID=UPI003978F15E